MRDALAELPPIGFGCSPYRSGRRIDLGDSIRRALEIGYRLLDTAEAYGNEAQIGEILRRRSSSSRPLVVSKVWQTNHAYNDVLAACQESLLRLGLEALDLYLVHAPEAWRHTGPLGDLSRQSPEVARSRIMPRRHDGSRALAPVPLVETWSAMEELQRRGLVRWVGVSNFGRADLEALLAAATIRPAVNQIERHPHRPREDLVGFCHERGIRVMAHSPLGSPRLRKHPRLATIGNRHSKSSTQVILRWNVELGVVPIPSSRSARRVRENLEIFDFALAPAEMAEIDGLAKTPASSAG